MPYRTRSSVKPPETSSSLDAPTITTTSIPSTITTKPPPSKPKPASRASSRRKPPTSSSSPAPPEPTLSFPDASSFFTWLTLNASSPSLRGIWLKLAKKSSPVKSITYDEALDIALCHGWIDGQARRVDETFHVRRFTPRRSARSLWSKRNVGKAERLMAEGRMAERGLAEVRAARADGRWEGAYGGPKGMEAPGEVKNLLEENENGELLLGLLEGMKSQERYTLLLKVEQALTEDAKRKKAEQVVQTLETIAKKGIK